MPRFPERLNLEQLKKQAKELLRAYEGGDGEALRRLRESLPAARMASDAALAGMRLRLHDAQSCLAREHGLPSWNHLVSYVAWRNSQESKERMERVPWWLHLVYGHGNERPQPLLAVRALREDPQLVQGELFLACAIGDAGAVRRAIANDAGCVHRTERMWPCPVCEHWLDMPPLVAVTHSSLLALPDYRERLRECARVLVEAGADANQSWQHGEHRLSALYGVAGKNHDAELTRLLLAAGADPNDGESLYHSIEAPYSGCTRLLLEAGARVEEANAVAHQLDRNDVAGLRLILRYAKGVADKDLLWAIRRRRDRAHVALLLEAGANPRARTKDGISAYALAVQCGMQDVAELLAAAGAGEELRAEERFVAACARGDGGAARAMLAADGGLIGRLSEAQLRQLPELTEAGNHAAARLMVELGWPVAVRGGDWQASALNLAVFQGRAELARFLLEHGASWEETHGFGDNVCGTLSWVSRNMGHPERFIECARVLLEYGAPLFARMEEFGSEMQEFLEGERGKRS